MINHDDNSGDWQGLNNAAQGVRYRTIANMLAESQTVLDVGCGEAVLHGFLGSECGYTGIDPSALAIAGASKNKGRFDLELFHGFAEDFHTTERFDAVVFNEMLYYSKNPVRLVSKFAGLIKPGGVMVCSIYQHSGVSWLKRIRGVFNPELPLSNVHCEKMVRAFMARERWLVLNDRIVGTPEKSWHVWMARPH